MRSSKTSRSNPIARASFPSPSDGKSRLKIGNHKYMWGSDYPHGSSTWPNSLKVIDKALTNQTTDVIHINAEVK